MTVTGATSPVTVSVVIPCFNHGRYLDDAVGSVLAQTMNDVEIIVVNDGSTDPATNELLADYRRPKTRVLRTTNRGVGGARNAGAAVARGTYICALDADDILAPTYFEKAVRLLEADPALAFVSSWLETFGDEQWVWRQSRCDLQALLRECTVCTAALVRASTMRAVGGYDEGMPLQGYEDWDFWLRIVGAGGSGTIIPEVLFRYRRRAGSMSAACTTPEAHGTLIRYLHEQHREHYQNHLPELLRAQDAEIAEVLRENDRLERQVERERLALSRKREELETLLRKSGPPPTPVVTVDHHMPTTEALETQLAAERIRVHQLTADIERVMGEVTALRNSKSWTITAPLRAIYRVLARLPREDR